MYYALIFPKEKNLSVLKSLLIYIKSRNEDYLTDKTYKKQKNNSCVPTFSFLVPVHTPTAFPVGEFALPQQILIMMCYSALLSVQIQPALKDAQMGIMLTAMRDNVLRATAPVSLALENTAHSAFPANRAGTDKEKDAWTSVQ